MKLTSVLAILLLGGLLFPAGCTCKSDSKKGYDVTYAAIPPRISGTWRWDVDIYKATGPCAGEIGIQAPRNVTITQNDSRVRISGFLASAPETFLEGILMTSDGYEWTLYVSGNYSEDQGVTTVNLRLRFPTNSDMTGVERWSWRGGEQKCDGESEIKAKKIY